MHKLRLWLPTSVWSVFYELLPLGYFKFIEYLYLTGNCFKKNQYQFDITINDLNIQTPNKQETKVQILIPIDINY